MDKNNLFYEILGWYGTIAILLAYLLASLGMLAASHLFALLLNLTGALGIVMISWKKKVYQPAVLNTIWAVIAVAGIVGGLISG